MGPTSDFNSAVGKKTLVAALIPTINVLINFVNGDEDYPRSKVNNVSGNPRESSLIWGRIQRFRAILMQLLVKVNGYFRI